jgi:hypothetical protein
VRTWRDTARPIIAQVLAATAGASNAEIRKALRAAYPFGERKYWPYKVWCSEIQWQRFGKRTKPRSHKARRANPADGAAERQKLAEWEELYGKRQP